MIERERLLDYADSLERVLNSKKWKPELTACVRGWIGALRFAARRMA